MMSKVGLRGSAAFALAAVVISMPAAAVEAQVRISIPAQSLGDSLIEFSRQTRQQLLFAPEAVRGRNAQAISGQFTPSRALQQLLTGSGLEASVTPSGAWIIKTSAVAASAASVAAQEITASEVEAQSASFNEVSGDIIVTARRRDENIQDVPISISTVTSDSIDKLNIRRFDEIATVVPGLTLSAKPNGIGADATIRGVNFEANASGSNGTIEFYRNDAPLSSGPLFQSMYDVRQIEVLRGPQGTLRGRASPSGSISITTAAPVLDEVGASFVGTLNDVHGFNVNGAMNIPIISDVLALRIAGLVSEDRGNNVFAVTNSLTPKNETNAGRVSVRANPFNDILTLDFSYESIQRKALQYNQVETASLVSSDFGPSPLEIRARDRRGVAGLARNINQKFEIYNWQAQLALFQQRLVYVGSRVNQDILQTGPEDEAGIFANPYLNGVPFQTQTHTKPSSTSHELRIQNESRIAEVFDYVLGGFLYKTNSPTASDRITGLARLTPEPELTRIVLTPIDRFSHTKEESIFGNVTAHIGDKTEISGGLRKIWYSTNSGLLVDGVLNDAISLDLKTGHTIYSGSIKHNITPGMMVYAATGSSWRPPISVVGGPNDPSALQQSFLQLDAETSKSYEIGARTQSLNNRLLFNITGFYQKFKNYPYRSPNGIYAIDRANGTVSQFNYVAPVTVDVKGIEADASFEITRKWNIGATLAYTKSKIKNGNVPCLDLNGDGIPDIVDNPPSLADMEAVVGRDNISSCPLSLRATSASPWAGVIRSDYEHPLSDSKDGFIRGLFSWKGNSQNDPVNPYDDVKGYGILNLYAGVRDRDGSWEVSLYGKNITNTFRVLSRTNGAVPTVLRSPGTVSYTNYFGVQVNDPREFGVTARVSFGSR